MFTYAVKALKVDVPEDLIRISSPFGGGMGRCEDICGTLIGGMMVIGLVYGRRKLTEDKYRVYAIAREFYHWFKDQFGYTTCSELNFGDFESQEHRDRCGGKFMVESIQFLDSFFERIDSDEWRCE